MISSSGKSLTLKSSIQIIAPDYPGIDALVDLPVIGVECDSRAVSPGSFFVAVKGAKIDASVFIPEAIARGAVAVAGETPVAVPQGIPFIHVRDSRSAIAKLASAFYDHPSKSLRVVGITGTNGKTTVSYLLEHFLNLELQKIGVIGTISYRHPGQETLASETTPGPLKLQSILRGMADAGCSVAVMEVSSHALDQRRVEGIDFEAALFTNLTQDHLDYHGTLEAYFNSKSKLFLGLDKNRWAVLNGDDIWNQKLKPKLSAKVLTVSIQNPSDFRASNLKLDQRGSHFDMVFQDTVLRIESPLIGTHNVYNVLGAAALFHTLGFDVRNIASHIRSFRGVPGRLERIDCGQNFGVFIDFAHTPDGLENVLKGLMCFKKSRMITLFGCGGDRDRGKRPQMADIASRFCDHVVLTSDNPRSEEPAAIAREICEGFPENFKNYMVILDRKKAIRQALLSAREGDIVLLAGKGHERVQIAKGRSLPFSDREEAEKVLNGH